MFSAFLVFFLILNLATRSFSYENDRCGINGLGICKDIRRCKLALQMLREGKIPNFPICGFTDDKTPYVCCYPNEEYLNIVNQPEERFSQSISQTMCNEYFHSACSSNIDSTNYLSDRMQIFNDIYFVDIDNKNGIDDAGISVFEIVGGEKVKPRELQFMGLVGYGRNTDIEWSCGCSLISKWFVLSAAHCTRHPTLGLAKIVRLGELDYSTKDDKSSPEDYNIVQHINHPFYEARFVNYDISLYKLNKIVTFSNFIRPICLPTLSSFENVNTVYGAGWGRTDFVGPKSSSLIKVELDFLNIDKCSKTVDFNVLPRGLNASTMICAGVLKGGRDTCSGDSGGPLYLPPPRDITQQCFLYTQLGITSFGKNCALPGYPSVYTNVYPYVEWIESIVWPFNQSEPEFVWKD